MILRKEIQFGTHAGFIQRITEWNNARYGAQLLNVALTHELLKEEVGEFNEATTQVDTLDALVDIIYVATGAMVKMGLSELQIYKAIHAVCDANDSKTVVKTKAHVKANVDKGVDFMPPETRLQEILDELT